MPRIYDHYDTPQDAYSCVACFWQSPTPPTGLRTDGENGLHYLLRDFTQLLLDESSGSGWGRVVREAREKERQKAEEAGNPEDISRQPLLDVGNRLISHLMSVSSCPEGKKAVLRANVLLVAGLVGLFGDVVEETIDDGAEARIEGHQMGRFVGWLCCFFRCRCRRCRCLQVPLLLPLTLSLALWLSFNSIFSEAIVCCVFLPSSICTHESSQLHGC